MKKGIVLSLLALVLTAGAPSGPAQEPGKETNAPSAGTNAPSGDAKGPAREPNSLKGWLREVEIKSEPGGLPGEAHYTVRIMPAKTQEYDVIVFELFYRQDVPWTDPKGVKINKVMEPVSYIYRRKEPSLVNDLDHYISFRVPVGRDILLEKHGEKTFVKDIPIYIAHLKMSGIAKGETTWCYDLPSKGKFNISEFVDQELAAAEKRKKGKEDLSDLKDIPDLFKKKKK